MASELGLRPRNFTPTPATVVEVLEIYVASRKKYIKNEITSFREGHKSQIMLPSSAKLR